MEDTEAIQDNIAEETEPVSGTFTHHLGRTDISNLVKLECLNCGGMFALLNPSGEEVPRCPMCDGKMDEVDGDLYGTKPHVAPSGEFIPFTVSREQACDVMERALGKLFLRIGSPSIIMLSCVPTYVPHLSCAVSVNGKFDYVVPLGSLSDDAKADARFIRCVDSIKWVLPRLTRECPSSVPIPASARLRPTRNASSDRSNQDDSVTEMPYDILLDIPSDRGVESARRTMGEDIKRRLVTRAKEDAVRRHTDGDHDGMGKGRQSKMGTPEILAALVEISITHSEMLWVPAWAIRIAWEVGEGDYDDALMFVHGETGTLVGNVPRFRFRDWLATASIVVPVVTCIVLAFLLPHVAIMASLIFLAVVIVLALKRRGTTGKTLGDRGFDDDGIEFVATREQWQVFDDRESATTTDDFSDIRAGRVSSSASNGAYTWH